ncbi:MAG: phosphoribosyltransferase [Paraclostridium sp.]
MKKILLMSLDFLDEPFFTQSLNFITDMVNLGNPVILYSRDEDRLKAFNFDNQKHVILATRAKVKEFVAKKKNEYFVVIGRKDKDFELAVNNKLLFIVPNWLGYVEDKANTYGINVSTYNQMKLFIETINNQNTWYSKFKLDEDTYYFSLSDAKSKVNAKSKEEREIIDIFNRILKKGIVSYYEIYKYHFLSCISNNNELFSDINHWSIFPSSTGRLDNNEMFKFKEQVRYIMKGQPLRKAEYKQYPNLLLRHTPTTKSHFDTYQNRIEIGAARHFGTVCLNPAYKGKLRGSNVCIFDDYLTHGNSFECARNLLKKEGVNKIIFVTLGTFRYNYQVQNYQFTGDVYSKNYNFNLLNRSVVYSSNFIINNDAKQEVENLHSIFNV